MFFAQLKSAVRSLRFRLMVWNAFIMLVASLGVLWGLREGVRYTLVTELDDDLRDDFNEISEVLCSVFEPDNPFFQTGMDRKARGHKQRSWFLQIADVRTPEQREQNEQRRREWQRRFGRNRSRSESARNENSTAPNELPGQSTGQPTNQATSQGSTSQANASPTAASRPSLATHRSRAIVRLSKPS